MIIPYIIIYLTCSFIGMAYCYATTKPEKSREEILQSYRNNQQVINAINALGRAGFKPIETLHKFGKLFKQIDHE